MHNSGECQVHQLLEIKWMVLGWETICEGTLFHKYVTLIKCDNWKAEVWQMGCKVTSCWKTLGNVVYKEKQVDLSSDLILQNTVRLCRSCSILRCRPTNLGSYNVCLCYDV